MSKCTILVVEDDPVQRRQLARALSAEDYDVLQASSGREAVKILAEKGVHLLLTDLVMPGMDGLSLLKYVRSHYPEIPVAILTSHPEGIDEVEPDAVLCKPFGERELKELVCFLTPEPAL